jgi:phosphoribosylformimino-5-aminoimidazole carboxamide ribotide isomerase
MFEPIPAIDILNGQAVRLTKGDYGQVTVYGDPVAFAKKWAAAGATTIHLVDLDGAKAGQPVNTATIKAIRQAVSCELELGGGLRTLEAVTETLALGINRVILGSIALKDRPLTEFLVKEFGGEKIVIGIDAKDGFVAAEGWIETSTVRVETLLEIMAAIGVTTVVYTDISRDGMLQGPNLRAYQTIVGKTTISIIASGGISKLADVKDLAKIKGLSGVIVGKALYENRINIEELFS